MQSEDLKEKKKPKWKLKVEDEIYDWDEGSITGAQIRTLASVPEGVQVWQKIKHAPDLLINPQDVVSLAEDGIEKFSLQEASSGAGKHGAFN